MKLTNFEIQREWQYRYEERLGMFYGCDKPTPEQVEIARKEADKWRISYYEQHAIPGDSVGFL